LVSCLLLTSQCIWDSSLPLPWYTSSALCKEDRRASKTSELLVYIGIETATEEDESAFSWARESENLRALEMTTEVTLILLLLLRKEETEASADEVVYPKLPDRLGFPSWPHCSPLPCRMLQEPPFGEELNFTNLNMLPVSTRKNKFQGNKVSHPIAPNLWGVRFCFQVSLEAMVSRGL
jgi:hypothetical protein